MGCIKSKSKRASQHPTPSPPPTPVDTTGYDPLFADECLRAHNYYRQRHGVDPLRHDPELSRSAQKWAEHLSETGKLAPSSERYNVGENIASKTSNVPIPQLTGLEATNMFYSDVKEYKFMGEENLRAGNFSQIVWAGSETAGFGWSRGKGPAHAVYVVGQYSPPGNIVGRWSLNVRAPLDGRTDLVERL